LLFSRSHLTTCIYFTLRPPPRSTLFPYTRSSDLTLTWGSPTLPSAMHRFTSEFGMGSGGSNALWSSSNSVAAQVLSPHSEKGEKDRKSTRLNSSHVKSSYAVFCLNKKKTEE